MKGKSPEQQDAILGKSKADLWRRGVITFRDMLDQSGRPLTLKGLRAKFDPTYIIPEIDTLALKAAKFTENQISRKYLKHSEIFGVSEPLKSNPGNWKKVQSAIIGYLNDLDTYQYGTYGYSKDSKVFYNKRTKIAVTMNKENYFLSAFIPAGNQLDNYLKNGYLR